MESIDLSSKRLGDESAVVIASLISSNTVTKALKCAAMPHTMHSASRPTDACCACVHSVSYNSFRPEGAKHVANMLAVNTTLQSVKCAD